MKAKKKYAERYSATTPEKLENLEDRQRKVLDIFSDYAINHNHGRILDIGCGDGNFSVLLKEACKVKEVYGIEISEKGVESARKNGVKCYQLDMDVEDFPFEDNYFDTVFAGEIIEHLFDPDHFLDEVYRILKPEGIFVITTPNLASIYNRIALLFGYYPFPINVSHRHAVGHLIEAFGDERRYKLRGKNVVLSSDHIHVFTSRSLKELLRIHKFDILTVEGSCAMLMENMRFKRFVKAVDKVFAKFPSLSYRVILECKKKSDEE